LEKYSNAGNPEFKITILKYEDFNEKSPRKEGAF